MVTPLLLLVPQLLIPSSHLPINPSSHPPIFPSSHHPIIPSSHFPIIPSSPLFIMSFPIIQSFFIILSFHFPMTCCDDGCFSLHVVRSPTLAAFSAIFRKEASLCVFGLTALNTSSAVRRRRWFPSITGRLGGHTHCISSTQRRLVWEVGSWVCEGRLFGVCRGLIWGGCVGGGVVWEVNRACV